MLGKLFGARSKKGAGAQTTVSSAQADVIFSTVGQRSIPAMSGSAADAFRVATDPKAEAREFIQIIEGDEALAARVIRMANSVFFSRGAQNSSIEEAVATIGLTELRTLLGASALSDIFPSSNPERLLFWEHDMAVAIIARALALESHPNLADAAFLAGLMHDVGKLLLLQRIPEVYAKVIDLVRTERLSFCQAEEQVFPFTHIEVGLLISAKWNFPDEVRSAIAQHHTLAPIQPGLPGLIALSNLLAHAAGLSGSRPSQIESAAEILTENWATIAPRGRTLADLISLAKSTVAKERGRFP